MASLVKTDREWIEQNPALWRKQTAKIRLFCLGLLVLVMVGTLVERLL